MRRLLAVAALGLLAACTEPASQFQTAGDGFVYADQSYDLWPMRTDVAEAWRLQSLRRELTAAGLCPDAYLVESRTEEGAEMGYMHQFRGFGSLEGDILEVAYRGRCAP